MGGFSRDRAGEALEEVVRSTPWSATVEGLWVVGGSRCEGGKGSRGCNDPLVGAGVPGSGKDERHRPRFVSKPLPPQDPWWRGLQMCGPSPPCWVLPPGAGRAYGELAIGKTPQGFRTQESKPSCTERRGSLQGAGLFLGRLPQHNGRALAVWLWSRQEAGEALGMPGALLCP